MKFWLTREYVQIDAWHEMFASTALSHINYYTCIIPVHSIAVAGKKVQKTKVAAAYEYA